MVVVMMMTVVASGRPLRLRRDRSRETEDNDETKQKLLHVEIDEFARMRDYLKWEERGRTDPT
jgi:hypothetical protein